MERLKGLGVVAYYRDHPLPVPACERSAAASQLLRELAVPLAHGPFPLAPHTFLADGLIQCRRRFEVGPEGFLRRSGSRWACVVAPWGRVAAAVISTPLGRLRLQCVVGLRRCIWLYLFRVGAPAQRYLFVFRNLIAAVVPLDAHAWLQK